MLTDGAPTHGRDKHRKGRRLMAGALALLIAGCSSVPTDPANPPVMPPKEKVIGQAPPTPVVQIPMDNEAFRMRPITPDDPLPTVPIGPITLTGARASDALRALLRNAADQGAEIPVVFDPGVAMTTQVNLTGYAGPTDKAIAIVCAAANLHCIFSDGVMRVATSRQYIISLPPIQETDKDAAYTGIMGTLKTITGQDATLDKDLKTITVSVTQSNRRNVERYLDHARKNRVLVVYDAYILEVTLNNTDAVGISWQDFFVTWTRGPNATISDNANLSSALSVAGATGLTNPISFATVFINKNFNVNALVDFLRQQGSIRTISQPKLTVMSGSSSDLMVGGKTSYIKETGTVASQVTTQTTVTTDSIKTGLELRLGTRWHDETIYTQVDLKLTDLVSLNPTQTGTTIVNLPETVDRQVRNIVRSRPGDVILLAGLNSTRKSEDARGIPFFGNKIVVPNKDRTDVKNTELVIVMQPTVVMFTPPEDSFKGIQ